MCQLRSAFLALLFFCLASTSHRGYADAPPESPALRAFGDGKDWVLLEAMTYSLGNTNEKIIVPAGFVTDLASIPPFLAPLGLTVYGRYARAAIIHDYLYWTQICTRDQADRLLVIAMKESNVASGKETTIYEGVHLFGSRAWEANSAERDARLPRIIPERYRRPTDPNESWQTYRNSLREFGVLDPVFDPAPQFCRYGDSFEIPRQ